MKPFVESLERLYRNYLVDHNKIVELFSEGKITAEEMDYILDAH